jgi:hypothetical protein
MLKSEGRKDGRAASRGATPGFMSDQDQEYDYEHEAESTRRNKNEQPITDNDGAYAAHDSLA